ncbi:MAG: MBL fold metallo-hydrolase [Clostridia bacterium]|nr:MBL fold metallo-hydrolase [Clostridia bacterium]
MKLHILGMNGPFPAPAGACSGYLATTESRRFLLDIGAGVFARLIASTDPAALDAVLLSHFHHDHISDLGVLRYYLSFNGQERALPVLAPSRDPLLEGDLFCFKGDSLSLSDVTITSFRVRHTVSALAYKITYCGKTLVYSGDMNETEGFADFTHGADLLLCDACLPSVLWQETAPHLSARHAACIAREAGVGRLLLTHMNPHYSETEILEEARAVFKDTMIAASGVVYAC